MSNNLQPNLAQAKNSEVSRFLAVLVSKCHFKTCSLNFLTVGHTHEDVDQLFGILFALVLRRICFQRPVELRDAISIAMAAVVSGRGEILGVFLLTHIRDFKTWMKPLGIKLTNAFMTRGNIQAPHSFTYKMRMDLTPDEHRSLQRSAVMFDWDADDWDVYCVVKKWMHSEALSQCPILILPKERLHRLPCPGPGGSCYKKGALSEQRCKDLYDYADALVSFTRAWDTKFSYHRAAQDLRLLADGRDAEVAPSGWLEAPGMARALPVQIASNNPYFGHLPDVSWPLLVKFKK